MKSALTTAYIIKIKDFEGPFDLLFHLIEENKLNIYDIPINTITDQYMEYLYAMQKLNLDIASEFLVMASMLLHIKSKMLLPGKKTEDENEVDPREELVIKLVEYKKYKDFAEVLREREKKWECVYYKLPEIYEFEDETEIISLSPRELSRVYEELIERNNKKINSSSEKNMTQILKRERVSLKSKINEIIRVLLKKTFFRFNILFSLKKRSRTEVVTGFLAVLELAKNKKVRLEQRKLFSDIFVYRNDSIEDRDEAVNNRADFDSTDTYDDKRILYPEAFNTKKDEI